VAGVAQCALERLPAPTRRRPACRHAAVSPPWRSDEPCAR
jgi:hypothetical protein